MAVFLIVSEYETLPGHHSDLILDPDESSNCTPQSLLVEVSHDLPSDPYKECHSDSWASSRNGLWFIIHNSTSSLSLNALLKASQSMSCPFLISHLPILSSTVVLRDSDCSGLNTEVSTPKGATYTDEPGTSFSTTAFAHSLQTIILSNVDR